MLGATRLRTDSIWFPVILHGLHDLAIKRTPGPPPSHWSLERTDPGFHYSILREFFPWLVALERSQFSLDEMLKIF
jgi:membrane protease YdiL (CAAX protease family)